MPACLLACLHIIACPLQARFSLKPCPPHSPLTTRCSLLLTTHLLSATHPLFTARLLSALCLPPTSVAIMGEGVNINDCMTSAHAPPCPHYCSRSVYTGRRSFKDGDLSTVRGVPQRLQRTSLASSNARPLQCASNPLNAFPCWRRREQHERCSCLPHHRGPGIIGVARCRPAHSTQATS